MTARVTGGPIRRNPRRSAAAAGLISYAMWASSSLAQTPNTCAGDPEPHDPGVYHFKTYTRTEPSSNPASSYKFKIISCVENDTDDVLPISWPVPVPPGLPNYDGNLPGNSHRELNAYPIPDDKVANVGSCLRYGEAGKLIRATMLVPQIISSSFLHNDPGDCHQASGIRYSSAVPIENFKDSFTNYIASDASQPNNTLWELHADVRVEAAGKEYWSYLEYQMLPFQGSKGQAEGISLRPEIEPSLKPFLSDNNLETASKYGKLYARIKGVTEGTFAYIQVVAYDRSGKRVGSVPMPFFLPPQ